MPYTTPMRTVAETPIFQRYAAEIWRDAERERFINFIAANPEAGNLIRGSGGCRKVRWAASSRGKSGGSRVIYFNGRRNDLASYGLHENQVRQSSNVISH